MVFSSTIFLFFFLPLTLLAYFVVGPRGRNLILLAASLLFYAWGETVYLLVMLFSIAANYLFGLLIDRARERGSRGGTAFALAVATNLGLLGFFKYANFFVDNLNQVLPVLGLAPMDIGRVHLPIGISFFTFQALSYIIDLYRNETAVQRSLLNCALSKALFPQLIAGPIVRYRDVAREIEQRTVSLDDFASGVQRFIIGLGKKVLIANVMGRAADTIFATPAETLPATLAWIGAIAFMLQIYFDFSGYSDMAIGLGRMFGFHFLENFNYPYIARSIREFWRRWHISLSTWLRDYLYIPLGGNRAGTGATYRNLALTMLLGGLWHGARWNFVVWGGLHGAYLAIHKFGLARRGRPPDIDSAPRLTPGLALKIAGTFVLVDFAWIFFRCASLADALGFLHGIFTFQGGWQLPLGLLAQTLFYAGLALFTDLPDYFDNRQEHLLEWPWLARGAAYAGMLFLLVFLRPLDDTPFIYFQF